MRRIHLSRMVVLAAALVLAAPIGGRAKDTDDLCGESRDVVVRNGKIVTMDAQNSIVSAAAIKDGRFVAVGPGAHVPGPCTKEVDLHGRTVIPGLIDNHNHIVLLGLRPGHDTRLESAASIADVIAIIQNRAAGLPPGEFITAIGGWNPAQFAEKRLPTLAELDTATSNHPVYVQQSFTGPSATNTMGKAFFESRGVTVSPTGAIAANTQTLLALNALRAVQTFDDKKRGTLDAMAYAVGLGVTTHLDMGGFVIPGTPNAQDSFVSDGAASFDPFTAYDPFLALNREGKLSVRLRVFFLSMDINPGVPLLTQRVLNAFREFGGDLMKVGGVGEFISSWPLFGQPFPVNYAEAIQLAAQKGWIYQQHTLSSAEDTFAIDAWEVLNATTPIADLHWSLAHVLTLTPTNINRLKAMGAGVAVHGFRYLAGTPTSKGPPYRTIVDSGIKVGAGSDSAQISTLNPWLMIYYMVTGKNSSGVLINAGETLTRAEALRLYTRENGWFSKEEDKLGSIEVGKYGDLVVLSDDYLDAAKVSDEGIKRLSSVLTVVGGKIVHDAGVLGAHLRGRDD